MPIYEYQCTHCSSRFELKQSFSENAPVSCPQCGSKARRIFSPAAIIYKGTGFYSTDNRNSHNPSLDKGGTDGTKADSKEEI